MADAAGPEAACAAGLGQAVGLGRVPPLARSATIDGPVFIAGTVLLPAEARYNDDALRMILAHELAHARRRDLHWDWLGTLVQVTFWFHPLVVLARREERLAREAAADALALAATGAAAADYGRMLLSLSLGQDRPRPVLLGAVGVIEGGTLLRRRLLALRDAASSGSLDRQHITVTGGEEARIASTGPPVPPPPPRERRGRSARPSPIGRGAGAGGGWPPSTPRPRTGPPETYV